MSLQIVNQIDIKKLSDINAILSKPDFDRVITELRDEQKWNYRDLEKFRALRAFMSEEENEFANVSLQTKAEQLRLTAHKLIEFSARHFFVCERHARTVGGEFLYRLYPRLQERIADGDLQAQMLWDAHIAVLDGLCDSLKQSHRDFRRAAGLSQGRS